MHGIGFCSEQLIASCAFGVLSQSVACRVPRSRIDLGLGYQIEHLDYTGIIATSLKVVSCIKLTDNQAR